MGGTLVLLVRLAISMAVVMGVMGVAARIVRRRQGLGVPAAKGKGGPARRGLMGGAGRKNRPEPMVEVVSRRALAKGATVTVVKAGTNHLLLGVTEHAVNLLADLGPVAGAQAPGSRAALVPHLDDLSRFGGNAPGTTPAGNNILAEVQNWQETGRMPVSLAAAATPGQPQTAWKLAIDSLRERTVRR